MLNEGFFQMPYPVETRISLVDLEDVAEAAAIVLSQEGHHGAIYELVGTKALSQLEAAEIISSVVGSPIRADKISSKDWEQKARVAGMRDYGIDTLIKMFHYYANYGLEGNPSVLGWLIGRPPTAFEQAVRREQKI
jgi:nucleoside-diphosphate-sugar epimerase